MKKCLSNGGEKETGKGEKEKLLQSSPMLDMFLQTLEPHQYFDEEVVVEVVDEDNSNNNNSDDEETTDQASDPPQQQQTAQLESAVER